MVAGVGRPRRRRCPTRLLSHTELIEKDLELVECLAGLVRQARPAVADGTPMVPESSICELTVWLEVVEEKVLFVGDQSCKVVQLNSEGGDYLCAPGLGGSSPVAPAYATPNRAS